MKEKGIDVYVIPSSDYHQSEYVGEYFKTREFISGFTGSAGTVVGTENEALWKGGFHQSSGKRFDSFCG